MSDIIPIRPLATNVADIALPLPHDAVVSISAFGDRFSVFVQSRPSRLGYVIDASNYQEIDCYPTKAAALAIAVNLAARFDLEIVDITDSADSAITGGAQ